MRGLRVRGEQAARIIGLSCVALTALGWGLNWPTTKLLLTACPPLSARGVAGLVAGALLFALAAFRNETLVVPRPLWGRLAIAALLNVSAWMGLTTASLLWLPAGEAATLAYTMPVWVTFLAWPILGERPSGRQIIAIGLGMCGVVVLVAGTPLKLESARFPGIVVALCAAVLFAVGTVRSRRSPIPSPRIALTAWQVTLGCLPLLAAGVLFEHPHFERLPMAGWAALAYTALVSMGMCYVLWFAAVKRLKASTAALGTLLTPIIGVVTSSLALGEAVTSSQILSLGLVAAGILLAFKD